MLLFYSENSKHINWCNSLGSSATWVQVTHRVFQVDQDPTRNLLLQYLLWSVRYSLRCVKEIFYWIRESSSNQSRTKQRVRKSALFPLFYFIFFKPLLFLCRNRHSGRLVLRKIKLFFPPSFFFHSKWPNLTAKRQELGPAILRHRKPRCKNGNVEYIRSKWREIIEVVQYCRWYWPNLV